MEKVSIPAQVTGPDAPTEESVEQQTQTEGQTEQPTQERPEWLPEKFKSAEDLVKAYGELESKLGSNKTETNTTSSSLIEQNSEKYTNEFTENGSLSEESIKEITEAGIPREYVDSYVRGLQALAQQSVDTVHNTVGGADNYDNMMKWAEENLSENEINAYNNAVESSDMDTVMMAVNGLNARYSQESGNTPSLIQGNAGQKNSSSAYRSLAELTRDMNDPRYAKDPAYRKDVENRLSVSNIF